MLYHPSVCVGPTDGHHFPDFNALVSLRRRKEDLCLTSHLSNRGLSLPDIHRSLVQACLMSDVRWSLFMALQKRHLGLTSCTIETLQLLRMVGTSPQDAINLSKHLGHVSGPRSAAHIKGSLSSPGLLGHSLLGHQSACLPGAPQT